MNNKLFLPLRINWNTRREILLRSGTLIILLLLLLTGFIGGQAVGIAQAFHRVLFGYITKSDFNYRVFLAGWIGLLLFLILISIPLGLLIGVSKAQTLKHSIWFCAIYSTLVIFGITLGLAIYSLLVIIDWHSLVFLLVNLVLLVGFNTLLFLLNREIGKQWKIRATVDYTNVKNQFKLEDDNKKSQNLKINSRSN